MDQTPSRYVLEYLDVPLCKSHKQSSIVCVRMHFCYLTLDFVLADDQISLDLNEVDPAIGRGSIYNLVGFVQVESDHVFGVEVYHLGHLVVDVPQLQKPYLGLLMSLKIQTDPLDNPTIIIILVIEKMKQRVSMGQLRAQTLLYSKTSFFLSQHSIVPRGSTYSTSSSDSQGNLLFAIKELNFSRGLSFPVAKTIN